MDTPEQPPSIILPLSKIIKGDNPRRYFDSTKHDELVTSIKLRGVLQPILVRPKNDLYSLVLGERRWRAALEAYGPGGGIPGIVREMTDQQALEAAIAENDDRDNPSETEQADAAVRYLAACQGDRAEAARRLGWSRAKLDRRLALAELAEAVKCALDERRIKVGHAELLAAVPPDKQEKALATILSAGLDVAKTRELLKLATQNLAAACFDKTECLACPFNSSTQRALFEEHVDDGYCTNAGCFELKTEAVEKMRLEEQERTAAAAKPAAPVVVDDTTSDERDNADGGAEPSTNLQLEPTGDAPSSGEAGTPTKTSTTSSAPSTNKATVTAQSIANKTTELREAMWRTALARALASNAAHARTAILVAAMSGTISDIKPDTLTTRAGLLVGASFPDLDYRGKIAEIRALPDARAVNVLAVIAAAYAKDVLSFAHVADLARAFDVDLRDSWTVNQAFLEQYTKGELKFIAHECGLIAHTGDRSFAELLNSKKPDLVAKMLNRIGFDWAGRLPSAMTLDGQYGPPPSPSEPVSQIAA
ncbi:PRTRC genetic system ParB family protein [Hephaestia caeni]|uniref:PRTRC genetic system ParB family protein n=1 Tax=Hephaestia caeni TaxID=645617 RepID=A0A397PGP2_9SPHN|nr:PRTRC system ParB family protein [Hephaestia caeni]RIA46425.1 PRTRC genetic system ParB family protein [Hephaestia caeni]